MPKKKPDPTPPKLSDQLRAWRARNRGAAPGGGLSQSEAAARLKVPLDTLQNWEQDRTAPAGSFALRAILEKIRA